MTTCMRRVARLLSAAMALLLVLGAPTFAWAYSYQVRVFGGNFGSYDGFSGDSPAAYTVEAGSEFKLSRDLASSTNDKYYVKGFRLSGKDELHTEAFTVNEDMDFVVALGVRGDMVSYTLSFVEVGTGKALANDKGQTSITCYGKKGDKPVIAYEHVEGYRPRYLNVTGTLGEEGSNSWTLEYLPVTAGSSANTTSTTATSTTATTSSSSSTTASTTSSSTTSATATTTTSSSSSSSSSDNSSSSSSGSTVGNTTSSPATPSTSAGSTSAASDDDGTNETTPDANAEAATNPDASAENEDAENSGVGTRNKVATGSDSEDAADSEEGADATSDESADDVTTVPTEDLLDVDELDQDDISNVPDDDGAADTSDASTTPAPTTEPAQKPGFPKSLLAVLAVLAAVGCLLVFRVLNAHRGASGDFDE